MKKIVVAALLSAVVATPAVAENMYAEIKLGSVNYGYGNVTNNSQAGFGLLGGYSINENFAMEVEYNNLGGFDSAPATIKGSAFGVSGVVSYPLNPNFSLFGKLGISNSSLDETFSELTISHNNTGLSVGLGGQYNIGERVGIRIGYDLYPVGNSTSGTSSAGMMYVGGVFGF